MSSRGKQKKKGRKKWKMLKIFVRSLRSKPAKSRYRSIVTRLGSMANKKIFTFFDTITLWPPLFQASEWRHARFLWFCSEYRFSFYALKKKNGKNFLRRSSNIFLISANSLALFPLFCSCRNGIVANLVFVTILAFFPSITNFFAIFVIIAALKRGCFGLASPK